VAYTADINIAVKGTKQLDLLTKRLEASANQIDKTHAKLVKWAEVTKSNVVPSLNNLNKALTEAAYNFNKSVLGTRAATNAARNLVAAEKAVNKELEQRSRLLNSIRGVNPSQYSQPAGPRLLAGQTSSIAKDGTGTLVGQRVNVEQRIKTILGEQDSLQRSLLELERKATSELAKKAELRAKNKQQFQSEVQALAAQANAEKAARQAEVEATKNIVAEEIKRREAGKLSGIQRRQNMEMANQELLTEIKLTKLAERRARGQKFKGAVGSGLIGGAFPLLFGQGLGASVGGAAGGFGGGMMGGQFGFALSLVGTSVGSVVDRFVKSISELGQAFSSVKPNITALVSALGETDTAYGQHISILEQVKGKEAAFEAVRERMISLVGSKGVKALSEFGNQTTKLASEFAKAMTQMKASFANFINSTGIGRGITGQLERANLIRQAKVSTDPRLRDAQAEFEKFNKGRLFGGDPAKAMDALNKMVEIQKEINKGNDPLLTAGKAKLMELEEETKFMNEKVRLGEKQATIEKKINDILKENPKLKEDEVRVAVTALAKAEESFKAAEKTREMYENIKQTIATGLANAIQGLIDGTKSLGESLASIAKQIASMMLQKAIMSALPFGSGGVTTGSVSDLPKVATAAQGAYFGNGIMPFSTGGMATRPTLGLIGEAGESEYIIPASKMAASMQRYSAGARGEAVIPGTGSSHAGGGTGGSTTVNYSGPILNFNSEEFVPKSAVGQIIATATSQGARAGENRTLSTLRNSRSARSRLGM